jgi:hypothetical protein
VSEHALERIQRDTEEEHERSDTDWDRLYGRTDRDDGL